MNLFRRNPDSKDVFLFVRRYDGDQDGRLTYSDFCEAITPKDILTSRCVNGRDMNHEPMSEQTRQLFINTLMTHFSCEE